MNKVRAKKWRISCGNRKRHTKIKCLPSAAIIIEPRKSNTSSYLRILDKVKRKV